ncbi:hypothetical protein DY000_02042621 [Brassica cretica]|nr:hypothetical protein DY000_02042621 [Brassica cretica]
MPNSSANASNDRRRPRPIGLNLEGKVFEFFNLNASSVSLSANVRNVRPQLRAASMPPGRTPASSQPTRPPGVVVSSTSSSAPPPPPPTYATRT